MLLHHFLTCRNALGSYGSISGRYYLGGKPKFIKAIKLYLLWGVPVFILHVLEYHLHDIKVDLCVIVSPGDLKNEMYISWDVLYAHNFWSKESEWSSLKVTRLNYSTFIQQSYKRSSYFTRMFKQFFKNRTQIWISPFGEFWTWYKDKSLLYYDHNLIPVYLHSPSSSCTTDSSPIMENISISSEALRYFFFAWITISVSIRLLGLNNSLAERR